MSLDTSADDEGEVPARLLASVAAGPVGKQERGALPARLRCRMKIFDFHPAVFLSVRPASLRACRRRDRATSPFT